MTDAGGDEVNGAAEGGGVKRDVGCARAIVREATGWRTSPTPLAGSTRMTSHCLYER
jgi:hypothetical protein